MVDSELGYATDATSRGKTSKVSICLYLVKLYSVASLVPRVTIAVWRPGSEAILLQLVTYVHVLIGVPVHFHQQDCDGLYCG